MRNNILALSFFLCASSFGQVAAPFTGAQRGQQWYVDNTNGSDSNTGHALSGGGVSAFKTIAHLLAVGVSSNAQVGIARSPCPYREEFLLTTQSYVTVYAYGSGSAPVLAADDIITGTDGCTTGTATWLNDSGDPTGSTWKVSMSTPTDGGSNTVNFFINGIAPGSSGGAILATSLANCEAASVPTYFPSSTGGGSWTLYYNSGSTSNPGTDGNLYEVASRPAGYYSEAVDHNTIIGIVTRRNHTNDGSLTCGNFCTIINAQANDGSKHNVLTGDGSNVNGLSMTGATSGDPTCCTVHIVYPRVGTGLSAAQSSYNNESFTLANPDARINALSGHTGFFTVTGATWTGGLATFTTSAAHQFVSGIPVAISGASPTGYNTGYSGLTVTVVDSTHFSLPIASNPGTWTSGGTAATNLGLATISNLNCLNVLKGLLGGYWSSVTGVTANKCGGISTPSTAATSTITNVNLGDTGGSAALVVPYPTNVVINNLTATANLVQSAITVQAAAAGTGFSMSNSAIGNPSTNGFSSIMAVSGALSSFYLNGNTFQNPSGSAGGYFSVSAANMPSVGNYAITNNCYHYSGNKNVTWGATSYNLSNTTGQTNWMALGFDSPGCFANSTP